MTRTINHQDTPLMLKLLLAILQHRRTYFLATPALRRQLMTALRYHCPSAHIVHPFAHPTVHLYAPDVISTTIGTHFALLQPLTDAMRVIRMPTVEFCCFVYLQTYCARLIHIFYLFRAFGPSWPFHCFFAFESSVDLWFLVPFHILHLILYLLTIIDSVPDVVNFVAEANSADDEATCEQAEDHDKSYSQRGDIIIFLFLIHHLAVG